MSTMSRDTGNAAFQAITQGTAQTVALGASSVASSAFGAGTSIVRLLASVDTWVTFGTAPTASASNGIYLVASAPEYFAVPIGKSYKVAGLPVSGSTGNLYITEGA